MKNFKTTKYLGLQYFQIFFQQKFLFTEITPHRNTVFLLVRNHPSFNFYKINKAKVSRIRVCVLVATEFLKAQLSQKIKGDIEDSLLLQLLSYQLVELTTNIGKLYRSQIIIFYLNIEAKT